MGGGLQGRTGICAGSRTLGRRGRSVVDECSRGRCLEQGRADGGGLDRQRARKVRKLFVTSQGREPESHLKGRGSSTRLPDREVVLVAGTRMEPAK